jgi:hypothetical protein
MSDTDAAATGAEGQPEQDQDVADTETDWEAEAEKWKALARKHEDQWKANASKVTEYDRLVEASKSDQERLEERAAKSASKAETLEAENLRLKVAYAKGLPPELIGRLQGSTQKELEADADTLLDLVKPTTPGTPDLRAAAGQRPMSPETNADDWLRQMAGRGGT